MKTLTDLEVAKQLDELWQTIERGIRIARETLEQAQQIHAFLSQENSQLEQVKSDAYLITNTIQDSVREFQQQQSKLSENITLASQIHDRITTQVEKIGNSHTILDRFNQELEVIHNSLDTAKTQAQQLHDIFPEFINELPQYIDEVKTLVSQVKINQQETAEYQAKAQHKAYEATQAYSQIESIITEFGGKESLDNLHLENKNIRNTFREVQIDIERLHKKVEIQLQKQTLFRNWLIVISFGLSVTLIVAIAR
jgi:DNA repair exonuclease SbcCD ATPase subunit